MRKVYSEHVSSSNDERLIAYCHHLSNLFNKGEMEEHGFFHKQLCDSLRRSMDTNKVIGLAMNKEQNEIGIFLYEIEAKDGVLYEQHYDENDQKFYILMPQ